MGNDRIPIYLTLGGLVVLSGTLVYSGRQIMELHATIQSTFARPQDDSTMQTISQVVTNTHGKTATITTTRMDSETVAAWLARHKEAVDAFEAS